MEYFAKLNSISAGRGQPDGILRVWVNGAMVFERTNAILRTAQHADMKLNQLLFGPWSGDGSPIKQSFLIDDLVVASGRP